jgi:hypothetical protein
MDKKVAGLLGAAAALTTMSAAQAAPAVGRNSRKSPAIETSSTQSRMPCLC